MKTTKAIKVRKIITKDVYCNKCKNKCKYEYGLGYHNFKVLNGLRTKNDFEVHCFDLCDVCYCKLIKSFKIKVDLGLIED